MRSKGAIVLDTNLLLLLLVGLAGRQIVARHTRLKSLFVDGDFDLLFDYVTSFQDIVCLAPIIVEVDYFANETQGNDRFLVLSRLRDFVNQAIEFPTSSVRGVNSSDFARLGFVDSTILEVLSDAQVLALDLTLASTDRTLVNIACSRGRSALLFSELSAT